MSSDSESYVHPSVGFAALIHRYCPDKIDFRKLNKQDREKNLQLVFTVGEEIGIPPLLDVEDMLISKPEQLSIITVIAIFLNL